MKILITGAFGLVGSDLKSVLQNRYGKENIILLQHKHAASSKGDVIEKGSVLDKKGIEKIIKKHKVNEVYHLATIMSAGSEQDPQLGFDLNLIGLKNILDLAVKYTMRVFWPSSIAVFGPTTPKKNTPQHTILEPTGMYGVCKTSGELLCQYYFLKYGLDVRSVRYPGLLGYKGEPGAGTTEYAIHIFYSAIKNKKYTCFLKENTKLPMMFIDDAISAALQIMDAKKTKIKIRMSYNISALSFTPGDLVSEIKKYIPDFVCTYKPDYRQKIADSWPSSINDKKAKEDWGWKPKYNLKKLTKIMYIEINKKLQKI